MEPLTSQQAYQDAPELRGEMLELLANAARLIETAAPTEDQEREHLLRRAAVLDRYIEEAGFAPDEELECERLAELLLDFDRRHDTGRGPVPAADSSWDLDRGQDPDAPRQSSVAYVRQEYRQWLQDETIREEMERQRFETEPDLEDHSTAPCPECGHDLEYGATHCPKCGTHYKYGHVFDEDGRSVLYARDEGEDQA